MDIAVRSGVARGPPLLSPRCIPIIIRLREYISNGKSEDWGPLEKRKRASKMKKKQVYVYKSNTRTGPQVNADPLGRGERRERRGAGPETEQNIPPVKCNTHKCRLARQTRRGSALRTGTSPPTQSAAAAHSAQHIHVVGSGSECSVRPRSVYRIGESRCPIPMLAWPNRSSSAYSYSKGK